MRQYHTYEKKNNKNVSAFTSDDETHTCKWTKLLAMEYPPKGTTSQTKRFWVNG